MVEETPLMPSLHYRRFWQAGSWLALIAVTVLSLMPSPPQPPVLAWDKAQHAIAYAVLGWSFLQAWEGRHPLRWSVFLLAVGVAIEVLQGLSGERMFEWADMLADGAGIALGVVLALRTPAGRVYAIAENGVAMLRGAR